MSRPLNNLGVVYAPLNDGPGLSRGWLLRCAQPRSEASVLLLSQLTAPAYQWVMIRVSEDKDGDVCLAQESYWIKDLTSRATVEHMPIGYPFPTLAQAHNVADEIERNIARGWDVVVHCWRGHDRTRFAVVAWQVKYGGQSIDQALAQSEPYFDAVDHIFDALMTKTLREFAEQLGGKS